MKTIELKGLDKELYVEKLDNGLDIYLLPYEDKKNYYVSYATKYGSDIQTFIVDGEEYTPPLGIAHYLEHKMFEEPSGEDPFTFFSRNGTDVNASTSYDNTQYICFGTKKFKENLKKLIEFVNTPYFTKENVEKERGIITEEIKMYSDIPDYALEMRLRENLYKNNPRKDDIAGTVEEINRITEDDLYRCYNSFYSPSNMFILIVGNFDIDDAMDIIKETLATRDSWEVPKVKTKKEPKEVVKKEDTMYADIEIPKLAVGIKVAKSCLGIDPINQDLYINMLTNIMFGSSSEFRERVRSDQILNDIYTEWEDTRDYKTFYLLATSKDPEQLLKEIKYELNHISIAKRTFERIKKVWIANEVKMIDDIEREESNLFDDIISYNKIVTDRIEIIRNMSYKTLTDLISKIDLTNMSTLKMFNKEITE